MVVAERLGDSLAALGRALNSLGLSLGILLMVYILTCGVYMCVAYCIAAVSAVGLIIIVVVETDLKLIDLAAQAMALNSLGLSVGILLMVHSLTCGTYICCVLYCCCRGCWADHHCGC